CREGVDRPNDLAGKRPHSEDAVDERSRLGHRCPLEADHLAGERRVKRGLEVVREQQGQVVSQVIEDGTGWYGRRPFADEELCPQRVAVRPGASGFDGILESRAVRRAADLTSERGEAGGERADRIRTGDVV